MNQPAHGAPLQQVIPAAYHLMIPFLIGPPMLLGGMFAMFVPKVSGTRILMVFFGAGLTWMGIRLARRKTVLIEVSQLGIMIYANPEAIDVSFSLLKDLFTPWDRLEWMRFLTLRQVIA